MQRWQNLATLLTALALLAGAGATVRSAHASAAQTDPVRVGVIYSRSGLLAAYGAEYVQGLRYGIAYATKGKNEVNGRPIELTLVDDAGDPAKAVSAAKDLI